MYFKKKSKIRRDKSEKWDYSILDFCSLFQKKIYEPKHIIRLKKTRLWKDKERAFFNSSVFYVCVKYRIEHFIKPQKISDLNI